MTTSVERVGEFRIAGDLGSVPENFTLFAWVRKTTAGGNWFSLACSLFGAEWWENTIFWLGGEGLCYASAIDAEVPFQADELDGEWYFVFWRKSGSSVDVGWIQEHGGNPYTVSALMGPFTAGFTGTSVHLFGHPDEGTETGFALGLFGLVSVALTNQQLIDQCRTRTCVTSAGSVLFFNAMADPAVAHLNQVGSGGDWTPAGSGYATLEDAPAFPDDAGGADHEFGGTATEAAAAVGAGALSQAHALGASAAECSAATSSGSLAQEHGFGGLEGESLSAVGSGALAQRHSLGGTATEAATETGTGELSPGLTFGGLPAESGTEVGAGGIAQLHEFGGGDPAESAAETGTGQFVSGDAFGGLPSEAATGSGVGTLAQHHALSGDPADAFSAAGSGAITQRHALEGAGTEGATETGTGALGAGLVFGGLAAEAAAAVGAGGVGQAHPLGGMAAEAAVAVGAALLAQVHPFGGLSVVAATETGSGALNPLPTEWVDAPPHRVISYPHRERVIAL